MASNYLEEKMGEESMTLEHAPTAPVDSYDQREVAKVVRKLDLHLLPLCFILYTFSVLDRSNLGNAKTAGLQKDYHLTGAQYSLLGTS